MPIRPFLIKTATVLQYIGQAFPDFSCQPLSLSLFLHQRKSPFCLLLIHNSLCQSFTPPASLRALQSEAAGPGSVTFSNQQLLFDSSFVSNLTMCNSIAFGTVIVFQSSLLQRIYCHSHLFLPLFWFHWITSPNPYFESHGFCIFKGPFFYLPLPFLSACFRWEEWNQQLFYLPFSTSFACKEDLFVTMWCHTKAGLKLKLFYIFPLLGTPSVFLPHSKEMQQ